MLPYTVDFEINQDDEPSASQPIRIPGRRGSASLVFPYQMADKTPIPDLEQSFAQQQIASPPTQYRNSTSPVNNLFYQYSLQNTSTGTAGPSSTNSTIAALHASHSHSPRAHVPLSLRGRGDSPVDGEFQFSLEHLSAQSLNPSLDPSLNPHKRIPLQPPSRTVSPTPSQSIVDIRRPVSPRTQPMIKMGRRKTRTRRGSMSRMQDELLFDKAKYRIELQGACNGGLRNAVQRAGKEGRVESKVWIGTLGMPTDTLSTAKKAEIEHHLIFEYDCVPVFADDSTFEGHYTHYCKQILWPTLHYQIPDNPKSKAYEDHSWEHYKLMNKLFADKICETYRDDGDIILVNDYHLLLVAAMVREKLPQAKIGFFLHVSFPSSEVFRCLAMRKELLEGILGANCVGFQIPEYSRHFLQTCNRILAADTSTDTVKIEGSIVSVIDSAIGIDPQSLDIQIVQEDVVQWREMIQQRWPNVKLIVARDKLDSIRGVRQKLLAYEEFLRLYPDWIDKSVLIQVCLSDMANSDLESDVTTIVERINSYRKNLAAVQPVLLLQQDIEFSQYLALLCEASAFAVTSLREGMNLTSHEFVYCNKKNGPLILSEFTGTARMVGDKSLLVNPWDKRQMAEAFHQALTMSEKEKQERHDTLYEYVSESTGAQWVETFYKTIEIAWEENQRRVLHKSQRLNVDLLRDTYLTKGRRIFFLDLDTMAQRPSMVSRSGSNTSIDSVLNAQLARRRPTKTPEALTSSYILPQRKIAAVTELMADPHNSVYVVSSDPMDILERNFRRAGEVGLIAENGGYVRPCRNDEWISFANQHETNSWKELVQEVLESIGERIPGSKVKVTDCTVTFQVNTSELDPERTSMLLGECINHINDAFGGEQVHAKVSGKDSVIVTNERLSKVMAAEWAFEYEARQRSSNPEEERTLVDCLFVADQGGEDRDDDEALFDWANQKSEMVDEVITVATSSGVSLARWRLGGINGLLNALLACSRSRG